MRFGPDGTLHGVWQRSADGLDHVAAMVVDPCGGLFISGYTSGDLVAAGAHRGERDAFLIKIPRLPWPWRLRIKRESSIAESAVKLTDRNP